MIPSHYRELSEDERIGRIAELFSLAVERYWRAERLAGRPFVSKRGSAVLRGSLLDLVTDPMEKQIVQFITNGIEASPRELQVALGISRATVSRKIARLRAAGLLTVVGRTRQARYALRGSDARN